MLTVISPAKKLDMAPVDNSIGTVPAFQKDAQVLATAARKLSHADLQKLMKISEPLAKLNVQRFKAFKAEPEDQAVKPAALAFDGDTYQGLDADTLSTEAMTYAQRRLRILSGLYGLLRPLDLIQPYRLEMGSRFATRRARNLYEYWGTKISKTLNAQAEAEGVSVLLNCASQEYFGAVDRKALKLDVIEPVFLERRDGVEKVISFYAKKARGAMARYIIQHRLTDAEALQDFDSGGYRYDAELSEKDKPVFLRAYPSA